MANFGEMTKESSGWWRSAVWRLLTAALYFTIFRGMRDENSDRGKKRSTSKVAENAQLEQYRPKLADMERQLANLKQQLRLERKIVPDNKEVEQFHQAGGRSRVSRPGSRFAAITARPSPTRILFRNASRWKSTDPTIPC